MYKLILFIFIITLSIITMAQEGSTGTVVTVAPAIPCTAVPTTSESEELWYIRDVWYLEEGECFGDNNVEDSSCMATCHNIFGSVIAFTLTCNYYGEWINSIDDSVFTENNAASYCDPFEDEDTITDAPSSSSVSSTSSVSSSYVSYDYVEPLEAVVLEIPLSEPLTTQEAVDEVKDGIIYGIVDQLNAEEAAAIGKFAVKRGRIAASHYTYESVSAIVQIDCEIGKTEVVIAFLSSDEITEEQAEENNIDFEAIQDVEIEPVELFTAMIDFWEDETSNPLVEAGFFEEGAAITAEARTQCWDGTFSEPCPEEPSITSILMDAASELVWIIVGVLMSVMCILIILHAWHTHKEHEKQQKFSDKSLTVPIIAPTQPGQQGIQYMIPAAGTLPQQQIVATNAQGQQVVQTIVQQQPVQVVQQPVVQQIATQQIITTNAQGQQVIQQVQQPVQIVATNAQGQQVIQQVQQPVQVVQQVVTNAQGQQVLVQQPVAILQQAAPVPQYVEGGHEATPIDQDQIHITIG